MNEGKDFCIKYGFSIKDIPTDERLWALLDLFLKYSAEKNDIKASMFRESSKKK